MIRFAIPLILTALFKHSFSFIDTAIVARFCDENALSAISLAGSLYSILASAINGFGVGCSVVVGKIFGKKEDAALKSALYTLLLLGAGLSCLSSLAGVWIAPHYVQWLQPPAEILELTTLAAQLYSVGIAFYGAALVASCLINGMGDSKHPFRIFTLSSFLNVLLDFVAVGIFRAGAVGCVVATLLSQAVSAVCMLAYIFRKTRHIRTAFFLHPSSIRETFSIGSASIIQESLFNALSIFTQSVVVPYGVDFINGYAIGRQIFSIFSTAINGYNRGYSTALAQNYGANQRERILEARRVSRKDGNILCAALSLLSTMLTFPLSRMILADASSVSIRYSFLYIALSAPMFFLSLHAQRASSLLRTYALNRRIVASSMINLMAKALCIYPIASMSVYLLPLSDIIGKLASYLYLKAQERKIQITDAGD